MAFKSKDLNRWATALGVDNDTDALRELRKIKNLLLTCTTDADDIAKATADAPDPQVSDNAKLAQKWFRSATMDVLLAEFAFRRHLRGRG